MIFYKSRCKVVGVLKLDNKVSYFIQKYMLFEVSFFFVYFLGFVEGVFESQIRGKELF